MYICIYIYMYICIYIYIYIYTYCTYAFCKPMELDTYHKGFTHNTGRAIDHRLGDLTCPGRPKQTMQK